MNRGVFPLLAALIMSANAVFAADTMKTSPFGVLDFLHWNHSWNNYQYPDDSKVREAAGLMKDAGVGMVRVDFLWQDVEPRRGCFDFTKYDRIVDILSGKGIEILGILGYAADWASPSGSWNDSPLDNSLFIAYARVVVERYKDRIRHWEVWNEPDSSVYWKNQDGLKRYCVLLKEVYGVLKEVDPGCTVLNGGLTHSLANVNRLYDSGGKGSFDALNIHIFENPADTAAAATRVKAYVRACAKVMRRNGDGDKKIWVTETGCPGVRRGKRVKNWWMGENPDEERQAEWLGLLFDTLLAEPQVERIFWAFFRDTKAHWKDGTDYLGLVRNDFSAKPSYRAFEKSYRAWDLRRGSTNER